MKNQSLKQRFRNYLNRLIEINEREFGTGSLNLLTFDRISRRQVK